MSNTHLRFPSLGKADQIGYAFNSDSMILWDSCYRASAIPLSLHLAQFPTYGDGNCQHGPERPIFDHFADACASFASYLADNVSTMADETRETIAFRVPESPNPEDIRFALSVKYVEDKRAFYSRADRKVSKADSKRFDKRWEEIPSWADGSVRSAWRILTGDKGMDPLLDKIARYEAIRSHVDDMSGSTAWCESFSEVFKLDGDKYDNGNAFRLLMSAFDTCRAMVNLRRGIDCRLRNLENAKRRDAEAAASQSAAESTVTAE